MLPLTELTFFDCPKSHQESICRNNSTQTIVSRSSVRRPCTRSNSHGRSDMVQERTYTHTLISCTFAHVAPATRLKTTQPTREACLLCRSCHAVDTHEIRGISQERCPLLLSFSLSVSRNSQAPLLLFSEQQLETHSFARADNRAETSSGSGRSPFFLDNFTGLWSNSTEDSHQPKRCCGAAPQSWRTWMSGCREVMKDMARPSQQEG